MSRCILDIVPKDKDKLLTVKFELEKLAEFYAASDMHRARTVSEFVHQYANKVIEGSRQKDPVRFAELVEEKKREIIARAEQKAKERRGLHGPSAKSRTRKGKAA